MPSAPPTYRKIPGTLAYRWASLFVGPDHLLQVTSIAFTESYRRFYYRDIQSITFLHTYTGRVWSGIWGGLALLFLLLALGIGEDGLVPLLCFSGAFVIPFAINLALGPTCACYVKTAVQQQRLHSLGRIPRARKWIGQIVPLITEAQGEMNPDELRRQIDGLPALRTDSPEFQPAPPEAAPPAGDSANTGS